MTSHQYPSESSRLYLRYALPLALLVVSANVYLNHFNAPTGIMLTPAVVPLTAWLISSPSGHSPITKALLSVFLISLHDTGIKLFGGGMHDLEGKGFITAFLLFGLVPAYLILIAGISRDKPRSATARKAGIVLFPLFLLLHLYLTSSLGMGECVNCQ